MDDTIDYLTFDRWITEFMRRPSSKRVGPVYACSDMASGTVILYRVRPDEPCGFMGQATFAAMAQAGAYPCAPEIA